MIRSYLYHGNSYTGKTMSLYLDDPLVDMSHKYHCYHYLILTLIVINNIIIHYYDNHLQLHYAVPYSMCKNMVDRFTQILSTGELNIKPLDPWLIFLCVLSKTMTPGDGYMRQLIVSLLVREMICRLFGTQALPEVIIGDLVVMETTGEKLRWIWIKKEIFILGI